MASKHTKRLLVVAAQRGADTLIDIAWRAKLAEIEAENRRTQTYGFPVPQSVEARKGQHGFEATGRLRQRVEVHDTEGKRLDAQLAERLIALRAKY